MNLEFKKFIENAEVEKIATKSLVLDFLKNRLNITDEDVILNMNISNFDSKVIEDLLKRGMFAELIPSIKDDIKNKNMSVEEFIDILSSK